MNVNKEVAYLRMDWERQILLKIRYWCFIYIEW